MNNILLTVHMVISVFGYQLGQPVIQFTDYPNPQVCMYYAEKTRTQAKIDEEYTLVKNTECLTPEQAKQLISRIR